MLKSIFFRRILALLLVALFLWAALTVLMYSLIARPLFIKIKVADIEPRAEVIANMASRSIVNNDPFFDSLLDSALGFFNARVFVVDGLSGAIRSTLLPDSAVANPLIQAKINDNLPALMSGKYTSLWFTGPIKTDPKLAPQQMLFVGVPIYVKYGFANSVIGAVFFVQPMDELNAGFSSLNLAMLISSLAVFLLMIGPAYMATARLIRPLRQTRDVALAMADGNFSVRADGRRKDEIGELASTMNNLAGSLEVNLADLTMERNRLRQIIMSMHEGLVAVDPSLEITQVNPAFWTLLGFDNQLEPLANPNQLPDLPNLIPAFQKAVSENQPAGLVLQCNGRQISARITPLAAESGQVTGAVGIFSDITEAEQLEQTRRDYVANISHELRTPLTAMRALIEPLRDGMVPGEDDRQRYYAIMLRETIRLSRLIDDMLELSRLQAGTLPMQVSLFDLAPLLDDLAMKVSPQVEDAGLHLLLPENLEQCPAVASNPDRIEQVLVILIDNAIKFTCSGGKIYLKLDWDEVKVYLSVQDTGVGIGPDDIDHVFDRFYKADKAHHQAGTGLGLSIAREIMQRLGEDIRVRSQIGRGSVFTLSLTRSNAAPAAPAAPAVTAAPADVIK